MYNRPSPEVLHALENALPVEFDNIPPELQILDHWLIWSYFSKDGKLTKVPINARSGKWTDPTNPSSWASFNEVRQVYQCGKYAGIGIALQGGLCAIDMDKCIQDGQIVEPFRSYIASIPTYYEISPSKHGVRGFLLGKIPGNRKRSPANKLGVEMYETKRFVSVTGNRLPSALTYISDSQDLLDALYNHLFPAIEHSSIRGEQAKRVYPIQDQSVSEIIAKASNARNSFKFNAFMRGAWQSLGYESKSNSDLAFCLILSYWTNKDPVKMRQIFESSGMADEKWFSARGNTTYGEMTIQRAIELSR